MAKSPWRRATSSTAKPHRPVQIGNPTPARISSSSSAVDQVPVKNSAAGIVRRPRTDTASNSASRASATAGSSDAGSAWASDPPIVPRLRIWKWPISGTARARRGTSRATSASRSTVACVVDAPIHTAPFAVLDAAEFLDAAEVDEVFEHGEAHRRAAG